jgi:hypothetical protein
MSIQQLSTPPLFLICGCVILFVLVMSVFFMIRAWKAGIAIGMDKAKLRKTGVKVFAIVLAIGLVLSYFLF